MTKTALPTPEEVISKLEPHELYPGLEVAEKDLDTAKKKLTDARTELDDLAQRVEDLPAEVNAGTAKREELEAAIARHGAAEKMLPYLQEAVGAAEVELENARAQQKAAVINELSRRRDDMQVFVDDEIAPLLERIRDCELAMLKLEHETEPQMLAERQALRRIAPPLEPIRWPVSVAANRSLRGKFPSPDAPRHPRY